MWVRWLTARLAVSASRQCIAFLAGLVLLHGAVYAKQQLTLEEAILLATRCNPHVKSTQLTHLAQKFNLQVQQWEFYPHYSLQAVANTGPNRSSFTPGISLQTTAGTQFGLYGVSNFPNQRALGLSLQIMQPLLRGFGPAVVEAALNNAKDSATISQLMVEGTLRHTITNVIVTYLDVMMVEQMLAIDNAALQRAKQTVQQTTLFIRAGHKAKTELMTAKANIASARAELINDTNTLSQTRYALLAAIGLDPNSTLTIAPLDLTSLIKKYPLPTLNDTIAFILKNDIQYKIDQITLHGSTSRQLFIAEDNTRWQLNMAATAVAGGNRVFYGTPHNSSVALTLQVPIDNQIEKQAVVNAKIALEQAKLALLQEQWNKKTDAITQWNAVQSLQNAVQFAREAEKFQHQTYNTNYQKYLHGLIDSLELQSAQLQLIRAQQIYVAAQINYLKALVVLDELIGRTLCTWHVPVKQIYEN